MIGRVPLILVIGLVLIAAGIIMIPIDINGFWEYTGYSGEYQFTKEEYSNFKRVVIEYSEPEDPSRTPFSLLASVRVIDTYEPILVSFTSLMVKEGFPYGERQEYWHDGSPADWLKVLLIVFGFITSMVGGTQWQDYLRAEKSN